MLSETPQRAMEPLEIATGFLPLEKASTALKNFVVILGGATQFHLGVNPHLHFGKPRCNRARTWGWVSSFNLSKMIIIRLVAAIYRMAELQSYLQNI